MKPQLNIFCSQLYIWNVRKKNALTMLCQKALAFEVHLVWQNFISSFPLADFQDLLVHLLTLYFFRVSWWSTCLGSDVDRMDLNPVPMEKQVLRMRQVSYRRSISLWKRRGKDYFRGQLWGLKWDDALKYLSYLARGNCPINIYYYCDFCFVSLCNN